MTAIEIITQVLTSTREVNGGELEPVTDIYTPEGVATLIRNALADAGRLCCPDPLCEDGEYKDDSMAVLGVPGGRVGYAPCATCEAETR